MNETKPRRRPALTVQRAQALRSLANFAEAHLSQMELMPYLAPEGRTRRKRLKRGLDFARALATHKIDQVERAKQEQAA